MNQSQNNEFNLSRQTIKTSQAPAAIGPYSQAVRVGQFLFCSGQIPLHPESKTIVGEDIQGQTQQVLSNIKGLLASQNLDFKDVFKTTVFLNDMSLFAEFNKVYETAFGGDNPPARSTVAVKTLPMNVMVEIECLALFSR